MMWGLTSLASFDATRGGGSPIALVRRSISHSLTAMAASNTRYLLHYDYIPEVLEKRGPYREGHLGLAKELIAQGTCVSGGPTSLPGATVPTGALFVFTDKAAAEHFVAQDPY